jgi:hypothetical protein
VMVTRTRTRMFSPAALIAAGALAAAAAAPALAQGGSFNYANFSTTPNLMLVGNAQTDGPLMALTPSAGRQVGGMWYEFRRNVGGGFDTTFSLSVDQVNRGGADGFAFVIQNQANTAIGGDGGALGYADNPQFGGVGITNSLAVEFDMWDNVADWADVDGNHISIQSRGLLPNSAVFGLGTVGAMPIPTSQTNLSSGETHTVRINYAPPLTPGGMGTMSVFLNDLVNPVLEQNLDLESILSLDEGEAFIGITAATGNVLDAQRHLIHNWGFTPLVPAPGAASLLGIAALGLNRRRRASN